MSKGKGKKNNALESISVNAETDEQQRLRFQVELEFIQCLANPNYLHFIAQRGYFKDQTFINYLKYLTYWKEPEYARYIKYPMCLYFLDLLQYEHFRREIVNSQCVKFIDDQAVLLWQHYTRRRMKLMNAMNAANNQINAQQNEIEPAAPQQQQQQQPPVQQIQPAPQQQQQQLNGQNGHQQQNGITTPPPTNMVITNGGDSSAGSSNGSASK